MKMSNLVFWEKLEKYHKLSSVELAQSVVKINTE